MTQRHAPLTLSSGQWTAMNEERKEADRRLLAIVEAAHTVAFTMPELGENDNRDGVFAVYVTDLHALQESIRGVASMMVFCSPCFEYHKAPKCEPKPPLPQSKGFSAEETRRLWEERGVR